jgi:ribosome hibernation promoting factor
MRLTIRTNGVIPAAAARVAQQRLLFALGRFANRVRSLTVRLSDVNGPRGGRDKRCAIAVRVAGSKRLIVVEDLDVDLPAAISRAAERTARAVARAVQMESRWHRVPPQSVE